MKRTKFRILRGLLTAALMTALLAVPSAATIAFADETITVNGEAAAVGDTVTFEYYMGGVADPLEAAGANIEYDPKSLEYIDGSIGFDVFSNAMFNAGEGSIYYSAIDVVNGFDLKDEKMIVKLSFKVLDGAKGDLTVTNTFDEIFTMTNEDVDLTEKDYTSRTVTSVNTYTKNDAPHHGIDANRLDEYENSSETDFDNVMLGTDKNELTFSEAAEETKTSDSQVSDVSEIVIPWETADEITASGDEKEEDVSSLETASSEREDNEKKSNTAVIAVIAVLVLLAVGAAVFAVLAKKKNK